MMLTTGAAVALATRLFDARVAGQVQLLLLLGTAPTLALNAINNLWAPAVYRAAPGTRGRLIEATVTRVVLGVGLLSVVVSLAAPLALRWLAPAAMMADAPRWAVCFAAVSVVPAAVYLGNVHLLFAEARSTALALITPASLVVSIGATCAAAREWGAAALLLLPSVFYAIQAGAVWLLRQRVSHESWASGRALSIGLVLAACTGVTAFLRTDPGAAWSRAIAALAVSALGTGLALRHRDKVLGPLS
jgi:hypothetical protein